VKDNRNETPYRYRRRGNARRRGRRLFLRNIVVIVVDPFINSAIGIGIVVRFVVGAR
jgi:hypothetical protein